MARIFTTDITNRDNVTVTERRPVGTGSVVGPPPDNSNPGGPTQLSELSGADDLKAIEALTGTGLPARTADNTWALRTLVSSSTTLVVTNGAGVAGNPSLALANILQTLGQLANASGQLTNNGAGVLSWTAGGGGGAVDIRDVWLMG